MTDINIQTVRTKRERRTFLTLPWKIYRDDPLWVPPLLPKRTKVIDSQSGPFFQRGEADFFIAYRDGEVVGTICAGEDPPINANRGTKECIFGFFEYIQDYEVFQALIERAAAWGQARGLNALYGPWNLDYEDSYGVLVEGRERPPALMCGHSPIYYQDFMTRYGFEPARAQNVALGVDFDNSAQFKRLKRIADRVRKKGRVTVREADFDHWEAEIDNLHHLLTHSLAHLDDHIGWLREEVEALVKPFQQIADPELILFADVDGETVGFFPGLPNLNEIFIHVNGLRYPWNYLQLLWRMRWQRIKGLTIKSVLVLPEYWNTGVSILLFDELVSRAVAKGYTWTDLSITGADNPNSIIMAEHMGAEIYKRWQVYRLAI